MEEVPALTPVELDVELQGANPPILVDVREAEELEIACLPNVVHIPLHEIPERYSELDPAADYVIVCRSGGRSAHATAFLLHQGFRRVRNLATGMNGWSRTVDPTSPEY